MPDDNINSFQHSIFLLGDNNVQNRDNPSEAFQYVIPLLQQADFVFLNLEGPFAKGWNNASEPDIPHKNWTHSSSDQVSAFIAAGIDAVGVANNVTYPWQAFVKSKEILDSVGLPFSGGGINEIEARKPVILEKNGLKVGFIQYTTTVFPFNHKATDSTPGINGLHVHTAYEAPKQLDKPGQPPIVRTWLDSASAKIVKEDLNLLKKKVDVVVASCHWGISDTYDPVAYQFELAHLMVESGADVVFGHGPHRLQKVEVFNGVPIFYSLGQGVFDDSLADRSIKYREGMLVELIIKKKSISEIYMIPLWREDDNELRYYNPTTGKGKELFEYQKRVTQNDTIFEIKDQKITINTK